jgi:hypothetical protein
MLYMDETSFLMLDRWKKLYCDFYGTKKDKDKSKDKNKNKDKEGKEKKEKKDKVKEEVDFSQPVDYSVGVFDLSKVARPHPIVGLL